MHILILISVNQFEHFLLQGIMGFHECSGFSPLCLVHYVVNRTKLKFQSLNVILHTCWTFSILFGKVGKIQQFAGFIPNFDDSF